MSAKKYRKGLRLPSQIPRCGSSATQMLSINLHFRCRRRSMTSSHHRHRLGTIWKHRRHLRFAEPTFGAQLTIDRSLCFHSAEAGHICRHCPCHVVRYQVFLSPASRRAFDGSRANVGVNFGRPETVTLPVSCRAPPLRDIIYHLHDATRPTWPEGDIPGPARETEDQALRRKVVTRQFAENYPLPSNMQPIPQDNLTTDEILRSDITASINGHDVTALRDNDTDFSIVSQNRPIYISK